MVEIRIACLKYETYINFCENVPNFCLDCFDKSFMGVAFEIVKYSFQIGLGSKKFGEKLVSMQKFSSVGSVINGTGPGVFGAFLNNTVDVLLLPVYITDQILLSADFPIPSVLFVKESFLVNPAITKPINLPSFGNVFTGETWILGVGTLLFMSFVLSFITNFTSTAMNDEERRGSFAKEWAGELTTCNKSVKGYPRRRSLFDVVFSVMFEQRMEHRWRTNAQKMFLITIWSVCALLGLKLFRAIYVEELTPRINSGPFENIKELGALVKEQTYKLIIPNFNTLLSRLAPESNYGPWAPLREAIPFNPPIYMPNFGSGLRMVRNTRGTALSLESKSGSKLARELELVNIDESKDQGSSILSFAVRKNYEYVNALMAGYLILKEMGIEERIYIKYGLLPTDEQFQMDRFNLKLATTFEIQLKSLAMKQIKDAWLILSCGIAVAAVVFVVESCTRLCSTKITNCNIHLCNIHPTIL